jgi:hypothetical protein
MMTFLWGGALFQPTRFDELYHLLAARGWLETGSYQIGADGIYLRGAPITWSVAQLVDLFGEHLAVARLTALIPTVALVLLGGWWLTNRFGLALGYTWVTLCILSPFLIEVATFVRWYGLMALLVGIFFASVFEASLPESPRRYRLITACLLLISTVAIALLQVELLAPIALAGILVAGRNVLVELPRATVFRVVAVVAIIGAIVLLGLLISGIGLFLWGRYRLVVPWAAEHANSPLFYHRYLLLYYPTLWPLTGVLWLIGRRLAPNLADSAVTIAGVGLLFQAGAGLKATRYIAYLVPWLNLVWALGLVGIWQYIKELDLQWPTSALARAVVAASLAFVVLGNAASVRALTLALGITVPPERPPADWAGTAEVLAPIAKEADILISSSELEALYAFGRIDYAVNHSLYHEVTLRYPKEPIVRDRRTGVRTFEHPRALQEVLECHQSALVVSDVYRWRDPGKVPDDFADLVEKRLVELDLPPDSNMRAWQWTNPAPNSFCPPH